MAALERARREAEARGATLGAAAITTADLGKLDWPVSGRLLYQFGAATGPNNTRIPWHGIGIGAAPGTPVRAVAAGTVSLAGPLGTYLTSILLDHGGGYYSFYGDLRDAAVATGDRVQRGQVIGHVGGEALDQLVSGGGRVLDGVVQKRGDYQIGVRYRERTRNQSGDFDQVVEVRLGRPRLPCVSDRCKSEGSWLASGCHGRNAEASAPGAAGEHDRLEAE